MTPESGTYGCRLSQRRKLDLWLAEWRASRAIAAVPLVDWPAAAGSPSANASGLGKGAAFGAEQAPDVGQVRLLWPGCMDMERTRPVYVAVFRQTGGTSWMVVPFSRFANPAIPGELRTRLRVLPLRVLCVWNARDMTQEALARTWLCRRIAAALVTGGLTVWRHVSEGAALDRDLIPRVGPPLEHPLDPRHAYIQEERELLDVHIGFERPEAVPQSEAFYAIPEPELRKAAERRGEYGRGDGSE